MRYMQTSCPSFIETPGLTRDIHEKLKLLQKLFPIIWQNGAYMLNKPIRILIVQRIDISNTYLSYTWIPQIDS